eukprot:scaffold287_cov337-Pavlova_lutheri.AAC.124
MKVVTTGDKTHLRFAIVLDKRWRERHWTSEFLILAPVQKEGYKREILKGKTKEHYSASGRQAIANCK